MSKTYRTHSFKKKSRAVAYAKGYKKRYGYKPTVFKVKGKGKTRYVVVRPRGLVRLG